MRSPNLRPEPSPRKSAAACRAAAVEIAGVTDVGRLRRRNEDAIAWDARLGVAMVADGMGGSQGGDVASTMALRSIRDDLRRSLADVERHGARARSRPRALQAKKARARCYAASADWHSRRTKASANLPGPVDYPCRTPRH